MLKIALGVFFGVMLSSVVLFVSYISYIEYQSNKVESIVRESKKRGEEVSKQMDEIKRDIINSARSSLCVSYMKEKVEKDFELISVDYSSDLLVAITYKDSGSNKHARCYMDDQTNKVKRHEIY